MAYTTIDDPSAYFQTALYNGSSSSVTVTNDGNSDLKPDWLWFKKRSASGDNNAFDTSRGLTERLFPNLTSQVDTGSNGITSLTDGFTSGTFYGDVNGAGQTFVTWQWKANGGTTSSNSSGDITSTNQISTTSGFGILTYTGFGEAVKTLGHNLGSVPDMMIFKSRSSSGGWFVYHKDLGNGKYINLHSSDAATTDSNFLNNTTPTSSLITLGTSSAANNASVTFVCYLFKSIQGYSKFGSYTGNGNADGPFVYTGFKPAWLLIKETSGTEDWRLYDSKRSPLNVMNIQLFPNSDSAEATSSSYDLDFLSNGFKLKSSHGGYNTNDDTYIFMAFAEHPFVSSEGVPVTAR